MYKTERQLTTKQNKVIYEEVYFSSDIEDKNFNNNNGFLLTYPNKFSQNPSQDKSIGIRRIEVIPPTHSINVAVEFNDGQNTYITPFITCEYQSTNTLQEILVDMCSQLITNNCFLSYAYDKLRGILKFVAINNNRQIHFRFVCINGVCYRELWQLFNQHGEIPFEQFLQDNNFNNNSLMFVNSYEFYNVWNRTPLYLHASFSDSKHHYVCKTGDYWEKPSKLFFDNVYGLEFNIYFTTDGYHKITPFYANKLLELSFILRTQEL